MKAAMEFSSRRGVLLFGLFSLLLPNGAFSNNFTMFPKGFANQPCNLANNKEGVCVYGYLCTDDILNIDGNGIIDLRFTDVCEDYFLKCCSKETPCAENVGTCVAANNCLANRNAPENKEFKQSKECDWSGYTCCPTDQIGEVQQSSKHDEEICDEDSMCVPDDQCTVNPDGGGLLDARSAGCNSEGHTCCPKNRIKVAQQPGSSGGQTNSIEQFEACDDNTVCVSDDQCLVKPDGDTIIQARVSVCNGKGKTCCPRNQLKSGGDPCNEVGGTCVPENRCPSSSSLQLDLRISQCDTFGHVCCMQEATGGRDQFVGRSCSEGRGACIPRKQCKGTTYRDKNQDCGGLACCATLGLPGTSPRPATTPKSVEPSKEGMACFNNNGKCRAMPCMHKTYSDRRNECGGLLCCANVGLPTKPTTTSTTPSTDYYGEENNEGKACSNNKGKCTTETCEYQQFQVSSSECGDLNCCAETDDTIDSDRTCSSVGGTCMSQEDCRHKTDTSVGDCDAEVCCVPPREEPNEPVIRDCGYRNDKGVKFETIGAEEGESQFGEFPWMVAIMSNEKGTVKFTCGGSLIDPEVVLTTAECVKSFKRTPDKLIVRAGEWDMGSASEPIPHHERRVIKIKSHPEFKATTLVNNIALLFLDDKFDQDLTINTVCLPPQNFVINNGEVTATGWGSTPQERTKFQQILKSINLNYFERSECERILRKGTKNRSFKLHRSFICAGGDAGTDTCTGDAGSPIVFPVPDDSEERYYAVGMVSWGIGCGRAGIPAAYTDIGFFRDWIDNAVEQEGLGIHYYTYIQQEEDVDNNKKQYI